MNNIRVDQRANEEFNKIGVAEELRITSLRHDNTIRNPVTIWVVRVGVDHFIRAVNGRGSVWFRGVQVCYEGHIRAVGVVLDKVSDGYQAMKKCKATKGSDWVLRKEVLK